MMERPILFSAPMVRAILDGSKTQTRRVFGERTKFTLECAAKIGEVSHFLECAQLGPNDLDYVLSFCPYGKPGDQLWVRETHYEKGDWVIPGWEGADYEDAYWSGTGKYLYAATDEKPVSGYRKWPSIHMKRKASRIQLEIVCVRIERLNDISEGDAKAEGCTAPLYQDDGLGNMAPPKGYTLTSSFPSARHWFSCLWDSLNGAGSWSANPWVWVVEYEVLK